MNEQTSEQSSHNQPNRTTRETIPNQVRDDNRKPISKRVWLLSIIPVVVFGLIIVILKFTDKQQDSIQENQWTQDNKISENTKTFQWPSTTAIYIIALPVDLTQIQSISKYRSCAGHNRDGYNFDRVLETDRSMKHYFYPIPEFQGTLDTVKIFSPTDGEIIYIDYEKDKVGGRPHNGGGLHISPVMDKNAAIVLGHINTVKDYKVGDIVKAGELVGYASLGEVGFDFDVDLSTPGGTDAYNGREILGSIFDHMTPEVLAEFAKYGVTAENSIVTKAYRDAHPCNYNDDSKQNLGVRGNPDSWIELHYSILGLHSDTTVASSALNALPGSDIIINAGVEKNSEIYHHSSIDLLLDFGSAKSGKIINYTLGSNNYTTTVPNYE